MNCLKSIYEKTIEIDFEVIVVDNASTDGSQEAVKNIYSEVILVESPINLGFGLANNLGVKHSKGEFLFLLNSDTILIENSIKILFDFFKKKEIYLNIGVLGCVLVDQQKKINGFGSSFPNPNEIVFEFFRHLPLIKFILPKKINVENYDLTKEYFEIDYVIGADMFLRKSLFNINNGFDKDYFMYYEESDLQLKLSRKGYKNYIYTKTSIIHLEDGSGKMIRKYSNKKRIIVHSSKVHYIKKNFPERLNFLKQIDLFILKLNKFNSKYSKEENLEYIDAIKKIY